MKIEVTEIQHETIIWPCGTLLDQCEPEILIEYTDAILCIFDLCSYLRDGLQSSGSCRSVCPHTSLSFSVKCWQVCCMPRIADKQSWSHPTIETNHMLDSNYTLWYN